MIAQRINIPVPNPEIDQNMAFVNAGSGLYPLSMRDPKRKILFVALESRILYMTAQNCNSMRFRAGGAFVVGLKVLSIIFICLHFN